MDRWSDLPSDDFTRLSMRYALGIHEPKAQAVIKHVSDADPEEELYKLMQTHPEEYALLTEHLDVRANG